MLAVQPIEVGLRWFGHRFHPLPFPAGPIHCSLPKVARRSGSPGDGSACFAI